MHILLLTISRYRDKMFLNGEDMAAICILDGKILEGHLPKKALEMVLE